MAEKLKKRQRTKFAIKQFGSIMKMVAWGSLVAVVFALITVLASMFSSPSMGTLQPSAEQQDYRMEGVEDEYYAENHGGFPLMTPCVAADDFGYPRAYVFAKPYPIGMASDLDNPSSVATQESYVLENVLDNNTEEYIQNLAGNIVSGGSTSPYEDGVLTSEEQIFFERENQAVLWKDSGLVATGDDLIVRAEGTWTSWFNGQGISQTRACILDRAPLSSLQGYTENCPLDPAVVLDAQDAEAIYMIANDTENFNAACWFQSGYGAYAMFTDIENPEGDTGYVPQESIFKSYDTPEEAGEYADPNSGVTIGTSDSDLTEAQISQMLYNTKGYPSLHLYGDLGEHAVVDEEGNDVTINLYGELYSPLPSGAGAGDRIWLKIQDRHYEDNAGFYIVKFKQGAAVAKDGAIEELITMVRDVIGRAAFRIYGAVVTNTGFQAAVTTLLVLYVSFMGLGYLIGWTKINQAELVMSVVRVSVVLALLSPTSWDFFYTYLFGFFLEGTYDLINMVVEAATAGVAGSSGSGPEYFDKILGLFFSSETGAKMLSVFFVSPAGLIYIVMLYIVILLLLYIVAKLVIVVLMALIPIALLIIVAPIFLVFILFKFSREYYKRWLQELFSNSLQTFLALAVLAFFTAIIMEYLQRTVGYRVCYRCVFCPIIDIGLIDPFPLFGGDIVNPYDKTIGADVGLKGWMPDIRTEAFLQLDTSSGTPEFTSVTESMYLADQAHYDSLYPGQLGYIWMDADPQHPGLELVYRNLIDMPFYDPVSERAVILERLTGDLVSFTDLLILLIISAVFALFVTQVPEIAMELATGSIQTLNLMDPTNRLMEGAQRFGMWAYNKSHIKDVVKIIRHNTLGRVGHGLKSAGKSLGSKFISHTDRDKLEGAARHYQEAGDMARLNGAMNALMAADIRALAKGGDVRDANGNVIADMTGRNLKTAHHVFNREAFDKSIGDAMNKHAQAVKAAEATYSLQRDPEAMAKHMERLDKEREDAVMRAVGTKNAQLREEVRKALNHRTDQLNGDKPLGGDDYTPKGKSAGEIDRRGTIHGLQVTDAERQRNEHRAGEIVGLKDELARKEEALERDKKEMEWSQERKARADIAATADRLKGLEAQQRNLQMEAKHEIEKQFGTKKYTQDEINTRISEELHNAGLPAFDDGQAFGEQAIRNSEELSKRFVRKPEDARSQTQTPPRTPADIPDPRQPAQPDSTKKKKKKSTDQWEWDGTTWVKKTTDSDE